MYITLKNYYKYGNKKNEYKSIFKKFQVDPLGYINEVKQEKRQGIIEKKCKKQKN